MLVLGAEALGDLYRAEVARGEQMLADLEAAARRAPGDPALLEPLDDLYRLLDMGLSSASLLRSVRPEAAAREAACAAEQGLQRLATGLRMSPAIFAALSPLEGEGTALDPAARRVVALACREARRAGVDLPATQRAAVRTHQEALVALGQAFSQNIADDTRTIEVDDLAGLPADYAAHHPPGADGRIRISTATPDAVPFLTYAESEKARRRLTVALRQRGTPANLPVLADILRHRQALARLLGHAHWADFATADKMAGSGARVEDFLAEVWSQAGPACRRDLDGMVAARAARGGGGEGGVQAWERAFLLEASRRQRVGLDAQALRPFFRLAPTLAGLMALVGDMLGLTFRRVARPSWHAEVVAYDVADAAGAVGRFFLDLHPRPGKFQHAAMFPLKVGVAGVQLPEACLVCNFPAGDSPMEHSDVVTLFHEFGHLLHHLLAGRQRWTALGGIGCEWDAVEVPSQLLEEWAFHAPTLQSFARDARGVPIPGDLVAKLAAGRRLGAGVRARIQVFYARVSLDLHREEASEVDPGALVRDLEGRLSPTPHVAGTAFEASFGHLEGYSALYYTYLWSEVIAADAHATFAREGLLSPTIWRRFAEEVLAVGGARPAADSFHAFLGRDVAQEAFAAWLNEA